MQKLDLLAIAIILAGIAFTLVGFLGLSSSSISGGGIIFFIGPIPIFIGGGTSPVLVLAIAVIMLVLTMLALLIQRRSWTQGDAEQE